MFLEISLVPSPLRNRGFYYWNYDSVGSNGGIICRVEECETRYRQTLKTLMADPSSPLQSTWENAHISAILPDSPVCTEYKSKTWTWTSWLLYEWQPSTSL